MTLLLGGARSGKSTMATSMARRLEGPVGLIATAQGLDDEMSARITRHRETRPDDWVVVEEPLDLKGAVASFERERPLVIDCLTLWVSNLMGEGVDGSHIEDLAVATADTAATRVGTTIVVTNEVGSGIVPVNALARGYRDLLGVVNSRWAERSDRVLLMVAGGAVPVLTVSEILGDGTGA
jgi:adenosyl cobinamide kinase/adenosyl cobinamide phosphate guanylyltransferase